jgi:hypothetical protein
VHSNSVGDVSRSKHKQEGRSMSRRPSFSAMSEEVGGLNHSYALLKVYSCNREWAPAFERKGRAFQTEVVVESKMRWPLSPNNWTIKQPNRGPNTPKTKVPLEIDPPFFVPQIPQKSEDIILNAEASERPLGKLSSSPVQSRSLST